MQLVEKTMEQGREHQSGGGEKDHAAVHGVGAGEEFDVVLALRGYIINIECRPHAGEDHGGIVVGIYPRDLGEVAIADHAGQQREGEQQTGSQCVAQGAPVEGIGVGEGLGAVFEHGGANIGDSWVILGGGGFETQRYGDGYNLNEQ